MPNPKPYEAVVFHDFFEAGLCFPCEDFLGEVLQRFNLHIHQLTPNAFSRLCVYAMALKMSGRALSVETFTCYYETQLHKKRSKTSERRLRWLLIMGLKTSSRRRPAHCNYRSGISQQMVTVDELLVLPPGVFG